MLCGSQRKDFHGKLQSLSQRKPTASESVCSATQTSGLLIVNMVLNVHRNLGLLIRTFIHIYFRVLCGKFGSPYLGKGQQPQEQRYPFLSECAVFSCVPTMAWLSVFGVFNVYTDADARDCTRGLYESLESRKRVCTES